MMSKHSNLHGAASGRAGRLTGLLARRGLAHRGLARAALVAGALGLAVGPALATAAAAAASTANAITFTFDILNLPLVGST